MKLYRIITGKDDSEFCHRISAALDKGWELYGSPSLTFDSVRGVTICGQAVVKEVDGKAYSPEMKLGEQ